MAQLKDQRIEYFVMSGEYERLLAERKKHVPEITLYEDLMNAGEPKLQLKLAPSDHRGPNVHIYQLRDASSL